MRFILSLGIGVFATVYSSIGCAGILADYTAKPAKFSVEKGVRVLRVQPAPTRITYRQFDQEAQRRNLTPSQKKYRAKLQLAAEERAFERGFAKGYEAAEKDIKRNTRRKRKRRNRYNYGRRYSTSTYNPSYYRFRSNVSYGRPAYIARTRIRK